MSNFVPEEMNLPKKGKSKKSILTGQYQITSILQNQTLLRAINQQSERGRHLTRTQDTPCKLKQIGRRRIHNSIPSKRNRSKIHKPDTITIAMTKPPILQGCKSKGVKLWTVSAENKMRKEWANNVYYLLSISQTVKYLHAAAGFPAKDTWTKAIKAGNFNTRPTITPPTVRQHFPESDKTQKGHMKKTMPKSLINQDVSQN